MGTMHSRRAVLPFLGLVVLATSMRAGAAAPTPSYVVIVHPSNPATRADRKFLADAFLKKTTRWDQGEVIRPVDQTTDSPVRRKFSEEVIKRSVAAVRSYWQQVIFSGRDVPPPELNSDEDVVKYVLKYSGAVGYVSGNADTNGTKVISVE
jgi:ABC-type phosphate transport system substrate-binding protein